MKKILIAIIGFTLGACGTNLSSNTSNYKQETIRFQDQKWNLSIPKTWKSLPLQADVLFVAQKKDENFVILKRTKNIKSPQEQIIESAKKDFFFFELIEKTASQWTFKGQPKAELPIRVFSQKSYSMPDSSSFLLGSCSYEIAKETKKGDCEKILKNWVQAEEE